MKSIYNVDMSHTMTKPYENGFSLKLERINEEQCITLIQNYCIVLFPYFHFFIGNDSHQAGLISYIRL